MIDLGQLFLAFSIGAVAGMAALWIAVVRFVATMRRNVQAHIDETRDDGQHEGSQNG